MVAPVGFDGELSTTTRVRAVTDRSSTSMSRARPSPSRGGTDKGVPPQKRTIDG